MALKFFEHFLHIADAVNHVGSQQIGLWDDEDGFYYDALSLPNGECSLLKVRSMVGMTLLFAVDTLEADLLETVPGFQEQIDWFLKNRPELGKNIASMEIKGVGERRLLQLPPPKDCSASSKGCLMKMNFSRLTASALSLAIIQNIRLSWSGIAQNIGRL